jgi:hypothetical protein
MISAAFAQRSGIQGSQGSVVREPAVRPAATSSAMLSQPPRPQGYQGSARMDPARVSSVPGFAPATISTVKMPPDQPSKRKKVTFVEDLF